MLLASGTQQGDGIRGPLGGLDEGQHGLGWRHLRDGPESGGKRKEPEGGKTVRSRAQTCWTWARARLTVAGGDKRGTSLAGAQVVDESFVEPRH